MDDLTKVTSPAAGAPLTRPQLRHLLRRLAFSATPTLERDLAGRAAGDVVGTLVEAARVTPPPITPDVVGKPWTNIAIRTPGMTDAQYDVLRAAQLRAARADADALRRWWVGEMIVSPAPLRETLTLFFHGTFGSTTSSVEMPHALYGCNSLLRGACLGTVPALLEALIGDPAMLIQIGMDEHRRVRVSDRPAKLVLDYWTVGTGQYEDRDVEALSRALTGWTLQPAAGGSLPPADSAAPRVARRTGLTPVFDESQFDARPKTLLGSTQNFDARGALRFLGAHPATARRVSRLLLGHLGVEDPAHRLEGQLAATYDRTGGSIEALLRDAVAAPEFWSTETQWALVKSPVHLAVGACRHLGIMRPPVAGLVPWLAAAGQILFDTPNAGEGGWPGDTTWVTPPDRLAIRYQLPLVLNGASPRLGLEPAGGAATVPSPTPSTLDSAVRRLPIAQLLERLDPAPGIDRASVTQPGAKPGEVIRRVMMTPHYQLA